jgi:lipopolysaccharide export system ATP-binding protein
MSHTHYAPNALVVHDICKNYNGRLVLNGVSFSVNPGEMVSLLGPNGAGKTTLFYSIMGLVSIDKGRVTLGGHDITRLPMYRRARLGIGYLPQENSIFRGMTVEENILAVLELFESRKTVRQEQCHELLEEFGITHIRKAPALALSGGERRRCEIARALACRPQFILLDEPFAGIDPIAVGDVQELIRHLAKRGIGVLITDHNVRETLELVNRAYILHDGCILMEGTPEAIALNEKVRRFYLGENFQL